MRAAVEAAYEVTLASLLALGVGMLATRFASHRRPWVFGWRAPANGGGWWLAPFALLGGLPAAAWVCTWPGAGMGQPLALLAAGAIAVAAGEVWFRGLVHGLLVQDFPVQRPRGPWILSRAALASAAAYAVVVTALTGPGLRGSLFTSLGATPLELMGGVLAVAFAVGLALAVIRERSLSLAPGIAIQLLGLLAATGLWSLLR